MRDYRNKVRDLLDNAEKYHQAYYRAFRDAETFGGPSLHFHRRALATRHSPGDSTHLEYVYATLASWGMHRMGKGGSKMTSFEIFSRSIQPLIVDISEAQEFDLREMDESKWAVVETIFRGIDVMESETHLVGHSKVLHHMMPDIVPPIDRQYTLRYLHGNTTIKNDLSQEWLTLREIVSGFFAPVASDSAFLLKAGKWIATKNEFPWDTSVLKVVDNLLIASKQ